MTTVKATTTGYGAYGSLIVFGYEEGVNPPGTPLTVEFCRGIKTVIRSNPSTGLYSGWQAKDDRYNIWHKVVLSVDEIQSLKEKFYYIGVKSDQGSICSKYFSKEAACPWEVLLGEYDAVNVKKIPIPQLTGKAA